VIIAGGKGAGKKKQGREKATVRFGRTHTTRPVDHLMFAEDQMTTQKKSDSSELESMSR